MDENHIRTLTDVKSVGKFCPFKGVLTRGRFTVSFLCTNFMLTVFTIYGEVECDLNLKLMCDLHGVKRQATTIFAVNSYYGYI